MVAADLQGVTESTERHNKDQQENGGTPNESYYTQILKQGRLCSDINVESHDRIRNSRKFRA
jgi:hypothetical protein